MGGAFTSSMLTLVIGGARSGKSRFAHSLAAKSDKVAYIATARSEDAEMAARIARHRQDRPAHWTVIEEPLEIGGTVARLAREYEFILLDCLTLWLSNFCFEHRNLAEATIAETALQEVARVAAGSHDSQLVVVSNELGCGLVPETRLGRFFRDLHGQMNQEIAPWAEWVYHLVAGISVAIKRPGA